MAIINVVENFDIPSAGSLTVTFSTDTTYTTALNVQADFGTSSSLGSTAFGTEVSHSNFQVIFTYPTPLFYKLTLALFDGSVIEEYYQNFSDVSIKNQAVWI